MINANCTVSGLNRLPTGGTTERPGSNHDAGAQASDLLFNWPLGGDLPPVGMGVERQGDQQAAPDPHIPYGLRCPEAPP